MRSRKLRSLLTVLGIILGVATIFAISIANESTKQIFRDMIEEFSGQDDLWVESDGSGGFDQYVVNRVQRIKGIRTANPISLRTTTLRAPGDTEGSRILLSGVELKTYLEVHDLRMVEGQFFRDKPSGDILLTTTFARENGISLREKVDVSTPVGSESFKVIGLLKPEGAARFNNGAVGYIYLKDFQAAFNEPDQVSLIQVSLEDERELKKVKAEIEKVLPTGLYVQEPSQQSEELEQLLWGIQYGLSFFSVIALFVGMFLIYNTFSMTVTERTREIGILRSLGSTRWQIARMVLFEALIMGTMATFLGLALGLWLARGLSVLMATMVQTEPTAFVIPSAGLITASIVGILVTLAGAVFPAVKASRIYPLDAIRISARPESSFFQRYGPIVALLVFSSGIYLDLFPPGPTEEIRSNISSLGTFVMYLGGVMLVPFLIKPAARIFEGLLSWLSPVVGKLALGNLVKARLRSAISIGTLMICISMLMGISAIENSIFSSVNEWGRKVMGSDLVISPRHGSISFGQDFEKKISRIPGVRYVAPMYYSWTRLDEKSLMIQGIDPQKFTRVGTLDFSQGEEKETFASLEKDDDFIIIFAVVAKREGLSLGDELKLPTLKGQVKFQIVAIVRDWGGQMGDTAYLSDKNIKKYFNAQDPINFLVDVEEGLAPEIVKNRIESELGDRYSMDILTNEDMNELIQSRTGQFFAAFRVIVGIAVIVALLGIINTLVMGVLERVREIGVLRAIGSTRWQVRRMVIVEALIMGIMGLSLGVLQGLYGSVRAVEGMQWATGFDVDYIFPYNSILIGIIIALIVSSLASLYPAHKAAQIEITRAISYE